MAKPVPIHENLRKERLRLQDRHGEAFTQANVARRIGVTQACLCRWESGETIRISAMAEKAWRAALSDLTREATRTRTPAVAGKGES